jgi:hypothetical protein
MLREVLIALAVVVVLILLFSLFFTAEVLFIAHKAKTVFNKGRNAPLVPSGIAGGKYWCSNSLTPGACVLPNFASARVQCKADPLCAGVLSGISVAGSAPTPATLVAAPPAPMPPNSSYVSTLIL